MLPKQMLLKLMFLKTNVGERNFAKTNVVRKNVEKTNGIVK